MALAYARHYQDPWPCADQLALALLGRPCASCAPTVTPAEAEAGEVAGPLEVSDKPDTGRDQDLDGGQVLDLDPLDPGQVAPAGRGHPGGRPRRRDQRGHGRLQP